MKWWLIFVCLVLTDIPTNGQESWKNGRNTKHACDRIGTACRCHRGRHFEQTIVCTKENCMHKLPTGEMPMDQLRSVVSLVVTKQPNITSIGSTEIRRLGNIKEIRITRCNISRVAAEAFMGLSSVVKLDLHKNHLEKVPPAIKQLRNLKFLNLGGNRLKFIEMGAFFSLKKLQRLILGRNFLVNMPELLPVSLMKITVSRNELVTLGNMEYLRNLKMLAADKNKLTSFPQLPHTVKIVSLCSNLIDEDISLQQFSNLTAINLSNNTNIGDITMLTFSSSHARSTPSNLRTFEARNSGIRSVTPNAFKCLRRLQFIDISHNEIRRYQESWFSGNRALRSVHISGNPFSCDCDVRASLGQISSTIQSKGKRKQVLNSEQSHSFHNDFHQVRCQDEETKGPCLEFQFVDKACTEFTYEQDAFDKTTTTTATVMTTPTAARSSTTTTTTTPITSASPTTAEAKVSATVHSPTSTGPYVSQSTYTSSGSSTVGKTTTYSTPRSTIATAKLTTSSTATTVALTTSSTTLPKTTTSSTTTTTTSTTPSTTRPTTTTEVTTTREPTTSSITTTVSTTPSTTSTTTTAEPTAIKTTTPLSTTSTSTTIQTTTSSTTAESTTTTMKTTTTPSTTTTTKATTTTSTTTLPPTTTSIVIPPIESISSQNEKKWCWAEGKPCVFPFLYEGEEQFECIPYWRGSWCAGTYIYDSDMWGTCIEC